MMVQVKEQEIIQMKITAIPTREINREAEVTQEIRMAIKILMEIHRAEKLVVVLALLGTEKL